MTDHYGEFREMQPLSSYQNVNAPDCQDDDSNQLQRLFDSAYKDLMNYGYYEFQHYTGENSGKAKLTGALQFVGFFGNDEQEQHLWDAVNNCIAGNGDNGDLHISAIEIMSHIIADLELEAIKASD